MTPRRRIVWPTAVILATAAMAGCASSDESAQPTPAAEQKSGGGFLGFGGGDRKREEGAEIGVNSLLWRATLDTISFMPLALTDSFGGVIITDWYADPSTPTERFKMQIYILDTRLRADGIKVNVFKQVQGAAGWQDAPVNEDVPLQLENAILAKARELRLATLTEK